MSLCRKMRFDVCEHEQHFIRMSWPMPPFVFTLWYMMVNVRVNSTDGDAKPLAFGILLLVDAERDLVHRELVCHSVYWRMVARP